MSYRLTIPQYVPDIFLVENTILDFLQKHLDVIELFKVIGMTGVEPACTSSQNLGVSVTLHPDKSTMIESNNPYPMRPLLIRQMLLPLS